MAEKHTDADCDSYLVLPASSGYVLLHQAFIFTVLKTAIASYSNVVINIGDSEKW